MPLEAEELRHLTAAEGYIELGMYLEANNELESIDPFSRQLPEVLAVKVGLYMQTQHWELMQTVAKKLAEYHPEDYWHWIHWAYATRRVESIEAARKIPLRATTHHMKVAVVHYNPACYECQFGNMQAAKDYLKTAFAIDPRFRMRALEDEDLEPLWDTLKAEL